MDDHPTHQPQEALRAPFLIRYLQETANLYSSLVLIVPIFFFYQAGVVYQLLTSGSFSINGADYFTHYLLQLCDGSLFAYIVVVLLGSVALGWFLSRLGRGHRVDLGLCLPLVFECAVYALLFATTIHLIQSFPRLLATPLTLIGSGTVWEKAFQAFGAGFNEELIFRLGILGSLVVVGRMVSAPKLPSLIFAFLVSSLTFSVFHHLGPYSEPFIFDSFMYRTLAGILLATLYWSRGLAVAVYTHALYDLYFFLILNS
ncbi:MAG: hypothetical protein AUK47_08735 [Deltaproteobacteria bacterium CG2_30_63_29]|nr:MAG: hypothetical protein AUK47_08735 [Deltaproteobacteria bacterium CG2_30_63_29]PIV99677.1 MAG: hypothetical protein COW42_10265 [Deltaproteobacteria bacterium CG17_big_fil_post_rev_8_21_14_2_50_63_7]